MSDIVDRVTRSRMMSGIRSTGTRLEIDFRRKLFARGLRYRINVKKLLGKPDIVFPRFHALIFMHGCFWHGHDCSLFRMPRSTHAFWSKKIAANRHRDCTVLAGLHEQGWRTAIIWECALRGASETVTDGIVQRVADWLASDERYWR